MTGGVPELATARLRLRAYRRGDWPAYRAMWSDAAVVRHIGGKPLAPRAAWEKFLRDVGHWPMTGFGPWAVTTHDDDRFLGQLGFLTLEREVDPLFATAPEIGWVFAAGTHGHGYATEAARAALAWGAGHFGDADCVCMIDPENTGSLRVAAKCGFREYARARYLGAPVVLLRRRLGDAVDEPAASR